MASRRLDISTVALAELLVYNRSKDAAKILSVTQKTLHNHIKKRGLPLKHADRIAALTDARLLREIALSGNRLVETAKRLHVRPRWLRDLLTGRELWTIPSHRCLADMTDEDLDAVVMGEGSVRKAAKRLGVNYHTVQKENLRRGMDLGRFGRNERILAVMSDEELEAVVLKAGSAHAAAKPLGVHSVTVRRELRVRGLCRYAAPLPV